MRQVHLLISGFVHGVGFRDFIKSNAKRLELTGWARNISGQRVEVIAQGDEVNLKKLIKTCKKGPFLSEVKSLMVEWQDITEQYSDFKQLPTV